MPSDISNESDDSESHEIGIPSSLVDRLSAIEAMEPSEREQAWEDLMKNASSEEQEYITNNTAVRGEGRDVKVSSKSWRSIDFGQSEARRRIIQGTDEGENED